MGHGLLGGDHDHYLGFNGIAFGIDLQIHFLDVAGGFDIPFF